ncbi:MAG: AAA family ATPase, partial [Ilumatobacteraceae bacterium]
DGQATIEAPWFDVAVAAPADDRAAVAGLISQMHLRGGRRIPQGVQRVLDAATSADTGYRSIIGMAHDLERCRDEMRRTEMCSPFPLALGGFALSWRDPRHIIGMAPQVSVVQECVDAVRADGRPLFLVVEGPSGAGRSSLLRAAADELGRTGIAHGAARFAPGDHLPLAGPRDLIDDAVRRLIGGPAGPRERMAAHLRALLGRDVALAVQLAPSLAQIMGEQAAPADGTALDVAARAEVAAIAVVEALATDGPFVALLDDADAADEASLALLQVLARLEVTMVLVLARRTDADSTALLDAIESLAARGAAVRRHTLAPVDRSVLHEIVSEGLGLGEGSAAPLAAALWARSGGNPGLAITDLQTLIADGDVTVDPRSAAWSWSPSALVEAPSSGVAEAARQRIARVALGHRQVLHAAALAGRLATPEMLALALDRSLETVTAILDRLHAEQFLEWRTTGVVAFHDDSIRRALVEALDGPSRGALRLRLARAALVLLDRGPSPAAADVFEALQLLDGHEHALTEQETSVYIAWCELAARSAHGSGGYHAALELQMKALSAVGPVGWHHDAERTFELHLRAAENAMVVGRTSLVDQLLDTAWAHQPTAQQRVRALRVLGNRWWTRQDQSGGLAEMHLILRELGEKLPAHPGALHVVREFLATRRVLKGRTPESFLEASPLTDERVRASLDAMLSGVHLAYTTEPLTHVLLVLRGIRLTARHGVSASSAYFVAGFGLLLCGLGRDLQRGIGFGRAGMALAERVDGPVRTMVSFAHNGFVRHWGEPLFATIEPLLGEYTQGLKIGRGGYAHTCGTFAALHALLSSRPLGRVDQMTSDMIRDLEQLGEGAFAQRVKLVGQAVVDLRHGLGEGRPLDGELFSEPTWSAAKARRGELALMVHTVKAFVALVEQRRDVAVEAVRAAAPHVRTAPGETIVGQHSFQIALLHALGADVDRRAARRGEKRLRRMAASNPHDYGHRVALLDAISARGGSERFAEAAAAARSHDALADLCVIANLAAEYATDVVEQAKWKTMALSALRAWGAEGPAPVAR